MENFTRESKSVSLEILKQKNIIKIRHQYMDLIMVELIKKPARKH